jgi:cytidine deaminase
MVIDGLHRRLLTELSSVTPVQLNTNAKPDGQDGAEPVAAPDEDLLAQARRAACGAYAPYSKFRVGAAVRAGGIVYAGCNIENASYGLAICAERVAIFAAIAAGARRIDALAVACIDVGPDAAPDERMPCGACRQVMAEFGAPDLSVQVDGAGEFRLDQLLPRAFTLPKA